MDSGDQRKTPVRPLTWITALVLSGISLAAAAALYSRLPGTIPVHWNIMGEADGFGPRWMIWIFGSLPLFLSLLLRLLPEIDPRRRNYEKSGRAYNAVFLSIVAFMTMIHLMVLAVGIGIPLQADSMVKAGIGVLFLIIGSYLGTVRSTFFFGIRTPWTLSSEKVWHRTHRLGGRLFVLAGLVFLAAAFFRGPLSLYISLAAIIAAVIIPVVYSYLLYRREKGETG
ncbi:SdpI family protein [Marispirochaeta aestuarii]|uniref:SdpI family protein n=1 Tax=Marispirochaeta aestuarii TaxID=1963862 RepID=UPI0029C92148|nr:SdpI family protein [Marispirochaeta aestuarii]